MDSTFDIVSAAGFTLEQLAALFTRGFEGYALPLAVDAASLSERVRAESIDLAASRVLLQGGLPVGLGLVALRGEESRVAAMGVVAGLRGRGGGNRLLEALLGDARARGDRRMRLEVLGSNERARSLYERAGFRLLQSLVGYEQPPRSASPGTPVPAELPRSAFARALAAEAPTGLPWQLEPTTLAAPPRSARCFAVDGASFALVHQVDAGSIVLRGLFTTPARRREGLARRLVEGLFQHFPGRTLRVTSLFPETASPEAFRALGFRRAELFLLEMELRP